MHRPISAIGHRLAPKVGSCGLDHVPPRSPVWSSNDRMKARSTLQNPQIPVITHGSNQLKVPYRVPEAPFHGSHLPFDHTSEAVRPIVLIPSRFRLRIHVKRRLQLAP